LEDAKLAIEEKYYTIDQAQIVDVTVMGPNAPSPAYDNDNGIGNNPSDPTFESTTSQKMYRVNSGTNKMGLGITLKVMAGDKVDIFGKSHWYTPNTSGSPNVAPVVLDILSGLLGAPGSAAAGKATATQLNAITDITTPLGAFINDPTRDNASYPQRPKAFINYIFFDEQFKMVSGGASPVNPTGFTKDHFSDLQNLAAIKNGYLYVYVSNESPVNVFFDNLQLVHTRSPLLEETHYYPFGLTMAGISSKLLIGESGNDCGCPNKLGFNGNEAQGREFTFEQGLNFYDFNARTYEQQLGRFSQIDPKSSEFGQEALSPYHFGVNNPVRYSDPTGECPWCIIPVIVSLFTAETVAITTVAATTTILTYAAVEDYKNNHANNSSSNNDESSNGKEQTGSQQSGAGRAANRMKPDPEATGNHTTFKRDQNGDVYQYQDWTKNPLNPSGFDDGKKFDGGKPDGSKGKPHHDKQTGKKIETPQVTEKTQVDGSKKLKEVTRSPNSDELPFNKRFKPTLTGN